MIKCYARIFAIMGSLFCLGTFFAELTFRPARPALIHAISCGLLFGAAMALTVGTLHVFRARKAAGSDRRGDIYAVRQSFELRSGLPYDRLFAVLTHYLKDVAGFAITGTNHESGAITARSRLNPMTFGSKVTAYLRRDGESSTLLTLTAGPTMWTTLADYGENLRIVRDAESFLRAGERH